MPSLRKRGKVRDTDQSKGERVRRDGERVRRDGGEEEGSVTALRCRPSSPPPKFPLRRSISSGRSSETDESPFSARRFELQDVKFQLPIQCTPTPSFNSHSHRSLFVLLGHVGSISCLALCAEFILSVSQAKNIIVWQQLNLRLFAKFGQGGKDQSLGNDDAINGLVSCRRGIVYSACADGKIKAWGIEKEREGGGKFKKSNNKV
ncbi:hypothetical protein PIB30_102958 [Stylosanthes scabra]|uniref:Uncharacterized protein n=1 Tax=Stylosanthes scabra TaxID=79078 RepID=A0ABU6RYM5_9FABA|nr:hypothetical protein [Stylosanthes scabra]